MLKIGVIIFVVVGLVVILGMIYISFKILRDTNQQHVRERHGERARQIHPKLKVDETHKHLDQ